MFLRTIVFLLLIVFSPIQKGVAEECSVVRINGAREWVPFSFYEKNKYLGISVDVTKEAFGRLGISAISEQRQPWKRLLMRLKKGEIDVITGAYYTSDRAINFGYSDRISHEDIRVFVKVGREFELNGFGDLQGRRGLRPFGGSYGEEFDKYANEHLSITQYHKTITALRLLNKEREDYLILAHMNGVTTINRSPFKGKLVPLPKSLVTNGVHALFSKASPCYALLNQFNEALEDMHADGSIKAIVRRYDGDQNIPK